MTVSVLVVEDDSYIRDTYTEALQEAGFAVDTATSKLEAIEKVRCKTYDVALVDIMLKGDKDTSDRGGVDVVSELSTLREGTRIVVVSYTDDINVSIKTFQAGIVDFIRKGAIRTSADIVAAAKRAADGVQHPIYGSYASLTSFLAAPELTPYWESMLINILGSDFQSATDILTQTLGRFLPLLRQKNSSVSFSFDDSKKFVSGAFWSKKVGHPVWVTIGAKNIDPPKPPIGRVGEELLSKAKGRLKGTVHRLTGVQRDAFFADIWEKP